MFSCSKYCAISVSITAPLYILFTIKFLFSILPLLGVSPCGFLYFRYFIKFTSTELSIIECVVDASK